MGLLGVLGLVLVHARRGGDVRSSVAGLDHVAGGHHRLRRHVDAVGAHVGDMAGLVEPLRGAHRLARAHAELAARLLLQRRGHERGGRVAGGGLRLDGRDGEVAGLDRGDGAGGGGLVGEVELVELPAVEDGEAGIEGVAARGGEEGLDGPVLAGAEGLDLHLAVDDQPQRHRLDAAGGLGAGQLAPEHRRQAEADEVVEGAAGEVGVDQRHVDGAGLLHRLGDGGLGDGVEDDALDLRVLADGLAAGQRFEQVPGDRLALAVGVGGEDELAVVLERLGDGAEVLRGGGVDLPAHGEVVVGIDRAVLRGQVADVAIGGEHRVAGAEILVDGLGLGGRFDDDDGHAGLRAAPGQGARRRPRCGRGHRMSTETPAATRRDRRSQSRRGGV